MKNDPGSAEYDAYYKQARLLAATVLGDPKWSGADQKPFPYDLSYPFRWSVWLGTSGLMALQRSHYDYCPDIHSWVRPLTRNRFAPTEPFYEWLMCEP